MKISTIKLDDDLFYKIQYISSCMNIPVSELMSKIVCTPEFTKTVDEFFKYFVANYGKK